MGYTEKIDEFFSGPLVALKAPERAQSVLIIEEQECS